MTMHELNRSKQIIGILHKLILGISYQIILDLYASWAQFEVAQNEGCLTGISKNVPGIAVVAHDKFQDNILTEGETSHRRNMMQVEPQILDLWIQTFVNSMVWQKVNLTTILHRKKTLKSLLCMDRLSGIHILKELDYKASDVSSFLFYQKI